jgi:hypothetical protein
LLDIRYYDDEASNQPKRTSKKKKKKKKKKSPGEASPFIISRAYRDERMGPNEAVSLWQAEGSLSQVRTSGSGA